MRWRSAWVTEGFVKAGSHVVVVLSYKGEQDTIDCVSSLVASAAPVEILVVDNGSEDGLLARVHDLWPHVHTLDTGSNLGFSGGMNFGLRWALSRRARTVTVLNNDTLVPPGALEKLVERALQGYIVSPEVRYADRPEEIWFAGGTVESTSTLPRHLREGEFGPLDHREIAFTPILAGCCITAKAEVWTTAGLFDERFFLMFEDSEWSLRAARRGSRLIVDRSVIIMHKVSASFKGSFDYLGLYFYTRNGLLFGSQYDPWNVRARLRFLRHHAATPPIASMRRGEFRRAARYGVMIMLGLVDRITGSYGPAPWFAQKLAQKWSAVPTSGGK